MAAERRAHGEGVVRAVQELLSRCGLKIGELAAIAVGIGPGSFTGLRIALSYAKGAAFATGCSIVGIPSLDALALGALEVAALSTGTIVCPVLDARKGEVYAAVYRVCEDRLEKLSHDLVITPQRLVRQIRASIVYFLGDGVAGYGEIFRTATDCEVMLGEPGMGGSSAAMVAALGAARVAHNQVDSAYSLQPCYVRPPEAEIKAMARTNAAGPEVLWSKEKNNLSASMQSMTRN